MSSDKDTKKRSYGEVWEAEYNDELKKEKNGFGKNIVNLKQLYSYQRYHGQPGIGYDEKIIKSIANKESCEEIDSEFMNIINWIALWKTNRIIEFDKDEIDDIQEGLDKLKELESYNDESKELLLKLLGNKGIRLPMASTIMHFYNPGVFPIFDRRAYRAVNIICGPIENEEKLDLSKIDKKVEEYEKPETIKGNAEDRANAYFEYIEKCKILINLLNEAGQDIDMKDIDKFLYEIDKLSGSKL